MKALLIIDMQEGCFAERPRYDASGTINRINTLSESFRSDGDLVVFIQHDGTKENYMFPGSQEWQILSGLERSPSDIIVAKTANGSFYRTNLDEVLREKKIKDVVITGCATDFCVEATVQAALTLDYNVVIIRDGHTTGDRPHASAATIIDHYNWIWENLTPTEGKIEVINLEDYLLKTA